MSQPPAPDDTSDPTACHSCGAATSLVHEGLRDRHFESGAAPRDGASGWAIRRCDGCAMCWLSPRPADHELGALYGDYYTHDASDPAGFEAWLKRAVPAAELGYSDRASAVERWAARALAAAPPTRVLGEIGRAAAMWLPAPVREANRLLDVGCGSGVLLARMRSLGWQVSGVEPDERGANAARARASDAVVYAQVEEVPAASFDAVTLSHVVEHLADPRATLAGCLRALAPGGTLVVSTPNPDSDACRRFGADWLHWDPPRHLQLFSAANLSTLLEDVGFDAVETTTSAGSAHFAFFASSAIERDAAMPGLRLPALPLATRLAGLRFWLAEDARVRRGEPCGEELVARARRPRAEVA